MHLFSQVMLALAATLPSMVYAAPASSTVELAPEDVISVETTCNSTNFDLVKRDSPHCTGQGAGSCNFLWTARGVAEYSGQGFVYDNYCRQIGGGPTGKGTAVTSQLRYTINVIDARCGFIAGEPTINFSFDYAGSHYGNCWAEAIKEGSTNVVSCRAICGFRC